MGTDSYDVTGRELPLAERDELWPKVTEIASAFADYQANTSRILPLFEISRG